MIFMVVMPWLICSLFIWNHKPNTFPGTRECETRTFRNAENVGWYWSQGTSRDCGERKTFEVCFNRFSLMHLPEYFGCNLFFHVYLTFVFHNFAINWWRIFIVWLQIFYASGGLPVFSLTCFFFLTNPSPVR